MSYPLLHPDTVTHAQAWRFFARRKPVYDAMMRSLRGLVPPQQGVVDVGANIGYFSYKLRTELQARGSFFLFEPHPNLARLCRETFDDAPDVQVQELALGAEDGQATLYLAADGNIGWNTMVAERREHEMQPVTVMVRRFDSIPYGQKSRPMSSRISSACWPVHGKAAWIASFR